MKGLALVAVLGLTGCAALLGTPPDPRFGENEADVGRLADGDTAAHPERAGANERAKLRAGDLNAEYGPGRPGILPPLPPLPPTGIPWLDISVAAIGLFTGGKTALRFAQKRRERKASPTA